MTLAAPPPARPSGKSKSKRKGGSKAGSTKSSSSRRSHSSRAGSERSTRSNRPLTTSNRGLIGADQLQQVEEGTVAPGQWQTPFMSIMEDGCEPCMFGWFCPCCALAKARHAMDGSSKIMNCLLLNPCMARSLIREAYSLKGGCGSDCLLPLFCGPCSATQLLNETTFRGAAERRWAQAPHRPTYQQPWRFGLCHCYEDCGNCCMGLFCPCCAMGTVRTGVDESDWMFNCCLLNPCIARSIVRKSYNIEGSAWGDCCYPIFCFSCTVCQMLNEVQHRGRISGSAVAAAQERQQHAEGIQMQRMKR